MLQNVCIFIFIYIYILYKYIVEHPHENNPAYTHRFTCKKSSQTSVVNADVGITQLEVTCPTSLVLGSSETYQINLVWRTRHTRIRSVAYFVFENGCSRIRTFDKRCTTIIVGFTFVCQ